MKFWPLIILLVSTTFACARASACDIRTTHLIEREAREAGVHPAYAVAIADTLTSCRHNYRDRHGRIGVMGLRPELAPESVQDSTAWLDYPPVNVRAAMTLLAELLNTHGDWETTLRVYYLGKSGTSWSSRRWAKSVFRAVDNNPPRSLRPDWRRPPVELDDFGPRSRGDWVPISRY